MKRDEANEVIREVLDEHGKKNPEFIARLNARIKADREILARLEESENDPKS